MRAKITIWEKYQQEQGFVLSIPWLLFIYIYFVYKNKHPTLSDLKSQNLHLNGDI